MIRFYRIDAEKFIKSEPQWDAELKGLETRNRKPSGDSDDFDCSETEDRIRELNRFKELREKSLIVLEEKDREAIEVFFGKLDRSEAEEQMPTDRKQKKQQVLMEIQKYLDKYDAEIVNVYRRKTSGLKKIRDFLSESEVDGELSEFYFFDIDECLKQFPQMEKDLVQKRAEAKVNYDLKSNSGGGGGGIRENHGISDPTGNAVVLGEIIDAEILYLTAEINLVKKSLEILSPLEREIVEVIALPKGNDKYRKKFIKYEEFAMKHFICESKARQLFRKGKNKMRAYIETELLKNWIS